MVNIIGSSRYKVNRKSLKEFVQSLYVDKGIDPQMQLNLILVGKRKMKQIALTYKQENVALPVLAFAYKDREQNLLGEICICYPQAVLLAAERNKKVEDILKQLIDHGLKNILSS